MAAGERAVSLAVPDGVELLVWWPESSTSTDASRKVLPDAVPLAHAAFSIARSALWVAAIAQGDLGLLREAEERDVGPDVLRKDAKTGVSKEMKLDLIDAMMQAGDDRISDEQVAAVEAEACPTCGSCSGMFTANSMNCLTEALGLSLPGNGTVVATHKDRERLFKQAGRLIVDISRRHYEKDDMSVLPRNVASKQAFENAMALDVAMGGSTNTVLHLLAAAHEAGVDFTMGDIDRLSRKAPVLCKVAPSTPDVHMEDVHRAGGIMSILGELDRQRDGRSFTTRRVVAIQHGQAIFSMSVSFQVDEGGYEHQIDMPKVPQPEDLPTEAERRLALADKVPEPMRHWFSRERPIELRPVDQRDILNPTPREASAKPLLILFDGGWTEAQDWTRRIGQAAHSDLARSRSAGSSANHRSGSLLHGSMSTSSLDGHNSGRTQQWADTKKATDSSSVAWG